MKTSKIIDGVKVVKENNKVELHIPKTMDGHSLQIWKDKNKTALDNYKAE